MYTRLTRASSYFTTNRLGKYWCSISLTLQMWLYLLFAPGDGSLNSMRCLAHFVWMGVLHFKIVLVKVKNKPWEEHTSICWVHKRICWQTMFDSEEGWVCVCSFYFPPLVTWKQDKGERRGKEKSEHHLYVKAHLSWGECRWMQTEKKTEIKALNNL